MWVCITAFIGHRNTHGEPASSGRSLAVTQSGQKRAAGHEQAVGSYLRKLLTGVVRAVVHSDLNVVRRVLACWLGGRGDAMRGLPLIGKARIARALVVRGRRRGAVCVPA